MIRPISTYSTPRKCSECQKPAAWWKFKQDKNGSPNESSRTPVCEGHQ